MVSLSAASTDGIRTTVRQRKQLHGQVGQSIVLLVLDGCAEAATGLEIGRWFLSPGQETPD